MQTLLTIVQCAVVIAGCAVVLAGALMISRNIGRPKPNANPTRVIPDSGYELPAEILDTLIPGDEVNLLTDERIEHGIVAESTDGELRLARYCGIDPYPHSAIRRIKVIAFGTPDDDEEPTEDILTEVRA